MILRRAGKATKIKKIIYLTASVILGILLSLIFHGLVEMAYLNWAVNNGRVVEFYGGCGLWPGLQIAILAAGAIGGFFLGRLWWRIIYVDRAWEKNRKVYK
ncbi:MAG: hypothetical protein WCX69_00465 [Candidatus Paceibacterota bacterium]